VSDARAAVFEASRRFGYAHRAVLPDRGAAVEALHDRTMSFLEGEITSIEEGRRVLAPLEALRAAYDDAIAQGARDLVAEPLPVAVATGGGWEPPRGDVQALLKAELARYGTADVRPIDVGAIARFDFEDVPFQIVAGWGEREEEPVNRFELVTTVPPAIKAFQVRVELGIDSLLGTVGLRREHRIGSPFFDGSFWIEGDRDAAVAALPVPAQEALLAEIDRVLALRIEGGLARLTWVSRPQQLDVPPTAIAALVHLRRALTCG